MGTEGHQLPPFQALPPPDAGDSDSIRQYLREIGKAHVYAGLQQSREERHRARQPIDLGHNEGDAMQARSGQCLIQRGPIRPLAALDFGELGNDAPVAAVEVGRDGCALRLEAKAGLPLLAGRNPVVSNETALIYHVIPVTRYPTVVGCLVT